MRSIRGNDMAAELKPEPTYSHMIVWLDNHFVELCHQVRGGVRLEYLNSKQQNCVVYGFSVPDAIRKAMESGK